MAKNCNARGSPTGHMVSLQISTKVKFGSESFLWIQWFVKSSVLEYETVLAYVVEKLEYLAIIWKASSDFLHFIQLSLHLDCPGLTWRLDKDLIALLFVYLKLILVSNACPNSSAVPANLAVWLQLVATKKYSGPAWGSNWAMHFLLICHV